MNKELKDGEKLEWLYVITLLISGAITPFMSEVLKIKYGTWEGMRLLYTVPLLGLLSVLFAIIHFTNFKAGRSRKFLFAMYLCFFLLSAGSAIAMYPYV